MDNVISKLRDWSDEVTKALRETPPSDLQKRAELIGLENEIDLACKRLALCERWQIFPRSIVWKLPDQKCQSPSSDFRIMEDCETEDRNCWVEADFGGAVFRFNQGDLIIQR